MPASGQSGARPHPAGSDGPRLGFDAERENRTLDVHIRTLRVKLGAAGSLIETIRGVGYKLGSGT